MWWASMGGGKGREKRGGNPNPNPKVKIPYLEKGLSLGLNRGKVQHFLMESCSSGLALHVHIIKILKFDGLGVQIGV